MPVKDTICWNCQKACGKCSWSKYFKPINGWKAKETVINNASQKNYNSFKIFECPEFLEDANRQKILDFCKKMRMSENLVNDYLSDNILNLSDLDLKDKAIIKRKIYFRRNYGK